jgi:predicted phosphodiesterase
MKILVLSDFHAEFHRDFGLEAIEGLPPADTVILAGDVGVYSKDSLKTALGAFSAKYANVVYVCGNHEFYGSETKYADQKIDELCLSLGNVHRLNHSSVTIDGQRFLGGTLWFPEPQHRDMYLRSHMNDFRIIRNFEPWVYDQHNSDVRHISHHASKNDIVVTHMIPSVDLITKKWQGSPLNIFFAAQMPEEVLKMPKLWVFGHTHDSIDVMRGSTRFLCNPYGYSGMQENPTFKKDLVIEV